jgi:hypothetical protein
MIMGRRKKYPESWIDDEKLSRQAYRFLREIVVLYQGKTELITYLKNTDYTVSHKLSRKTGQEIKNWMIEIDCSLLRDRNQFLESENRIPLYSPSPPPRPKDDAAFYVFKEELIQLCKKHNVEIGFDWDLGMEVFKRIYEDDEEPELFIKNNIEI